MKIIVFVLVFVSICTSLPTKSNEDKHTKRSVASSHPGNRLAKNRRDAKIESSASDSASNKSVIATEQESNSTFNAVKLGLTASQHLPLKERSFDFQNPSSVEEFIKIPIQKPIFVEEPYIVRVRVPHFVKVPHVVEIKEPHFHTGQRESLQFGDGSFQGTHKTPFGGPSHIFQGFPDDSSTIEITNVYPGLPVYTDVSTGFEHFSEISGIHESFPGFGDNPFEGFETLQPQYEEIPTIVLSDDKVDVGADSISVDAIAKFKTTNESVVTSSRKEPVKVKKVLDLTPQDLKIKDKF